MGVKTLHFFIASTLLFLVGTVPLKVFSITSTNYTIDADVISTGGTQQATSTNYDLADTLGEGLIGNTTSTDSGNSDSPYGLRAGFQELYPDGYVSFSVASATIDFGSITSGSTATGSHTMTIDTSAGGGFSITVTGDAPTKGSEVIDAIGAVAAASSAGTEQFGINLVANTSPAVGANPSGTAPIGSAASPYDTADQFAYQSGDTVAEANSSTNETVFTVSYIANVSSSTEAGDYSTTLTYSVTGNF